MLQAWYLDLLATPSLISLWFYSIVLFHILHQNLQIYSPSPDLLPEFQTYVTTDYTILPVGRFNRNFKLNMLKPKLLIFPANLAPPDASSSQLVPRLLFLWCRPQGFTISLTPLLHSPHLTISKSYWHYFWNIFKIGSLLPHTSAAILAQAIFLGLDCGTTIYSLNSREWPHSGGIIARVFYIYPSDTEF